MASVAETPTWRAGVYQLEITDEAEGGAAGVMNAPIKDLADRTAYLREQADPAFAIANVLAMTSLL